MKQVYFVVVLPNGSVAEPRVDNDRIALTIAGMSACMGAVNVIALEVPS